VCKAAKKEEKGDKKNGCNLKVWKMVQFSKQKMKRQKIFKRNLEEKNAFTNMEKMYFFHETEFLLS